MAIVHARMPKKVRIKVDSVDLQGVPEIIDGLEQIVADVVTKILVKHGAKGENSYIIGEYPGGCDYNTDDRELDIDVETDADLKRSERKTIVNEIVLKLENIFPPDHLIWHIFTGIKFSDAGTVTFERFGTYLPWDKFVKDDKSEHLFERVKE